MIDNCQKAKDDVAQRPFDSETQICGEKAFHHRLHKTKDRWEGRKCGQEL